MTFSVKTADALAFISKLVYQDEAEVENEAHNMGFPEFVWFEALDTQAAIFTNDDRCILAFRGTTNVTDWLTNLDVFKAPGPYGQVHHGFQEALNHVWDNIEPAISQHKELFITGHSLGGALATLATAEWGEGTLYTFGSPRVGDPEFAKYFDAMHPSYRFVNNNDIVPRVPLGYQHIGSLRHFTVGGKMWVEPSLRWVEWDRLCGRLRFRFGDGVKDHDIDDYISLIEKQL